MSTKLAHDTAKKVRTKDVIISEDVTFECMMLSDQTLQGLSRCGFVKPSPVQLKAVPLGRCGFDLLVEGKSGTGKTLIFSIVALEMIDVSQGLQSVIVAPTREIAIQISEVISEIGQFYKGLKVSVVTGGTDVKKDFTLFSETSSMVHILVGSPGRLRYLISKNVIPTQSIKLFVLDEADKLMSSTFLEDINYFYNVLPKRKQVIATSATYTDELRQFVARYMNSPSHIKPDQSSVLLGLNQYFVLTNYHDNTFKQIMIKFDEVKKILSSLPFNQCLIFCNYQARAKLICDMLRKEKWPSSYIAGSQTQEERTAGLRNLQHFTCRILVATDLAARGLDAANVDLVINFDKPYELPTYLHRIGRAGRYGSFGNAVTILPNQTEKEEFWTILSSLNEEINIQNLWDGKVHSVVKSSPLSNELDISDITNNLGNNILNLIIKNTTNEENNISDFDDLMKSLNGFDAKTDKLGNIYETFDSLIDSLDNFESSDSVNTNPQQNVHYNLNSKQNNIFGFIDSVLSPNFYKNLQIDQKRNGLKDLHDDDCILVNGDDIHSNRKKIKKSYLQSPAIEENSLQSVFENKKKIAKNSVLETVNVNECNGANLLTKKHIKARVYEKSENVHKNNNGFHEFHSSDESSDSYESENSSGSVDEESDVEENYSYFKRNSRKYSNIPKPFSYKYYKTWRFNLALHSEFIRQKIFIRELCNWHSRLD